MKTLFQGHLEGKGKFSITAPHLEDFHEELKKLFGDLNGRKVTYKHPTVKGVACSYKFMKPKDRN